MKRKTFLGLVLVTIVVVVSGYVALEQKEEAAEEKPSTIRIAAFNIQIFGESKRHKDYVMEVLVDIVREFDIVLIQEIRDSSEETAPYLLQWINEIEGPEYRFVRSERLGRTTSREAYAYFFNSETVEIIEDSDRVYNDASDVFEREPYIVSFRSGNFDFTLVGMHTKPDDAYSEIGNLTFVVSSILSENPEEKDIIVLGDLNADGRYFDEDDPSSPFKASEFYWVITNEMDTMTKTDYTYDRIVLVNATYSHEYVEHSAKVFYFDQEYELNNSTLVLEVSDHYPIYAEFRIGLADDD
ncbi:MAG: endonuclease/exonuclease/phosphatase family protein [Candidatus Bathyarchaeia archaeon]